MLHEVPVGTFSAVWAVDFEFRSDPGERPWPVCMVGRELYSGREIRLWRDDLLCLREAPFNVGPDALFVSYFASAELGCFLELGWQLPVNIVDLYAEHRCETNGKHLPCGNGLIGALAIRGLAHIDAGEKEAMRQLIRTRRDWSDQEKLEILDYCASDVDALIALLPRMTPTIDWPRALHRGRYMAAVARMERTGIPIDAPLHARLMENWTEIKAHLISEVDRDFGIYDRTVFKQSRFANFLRVNNIAWPHLPSGALALDGDTFDEMARVHPRLRSLYELRSSLSELRLVNIAVGADQRSRCLLSPFQSSTGRNQPSTSKFPFGPARWIRGLIREQQGHALAYIDWSAQEIAIAAGLSGDECLADDYASGDIYLSFAKAVGLVPEDATKESHGEIREACKTIQLGVLYGMGPVTMALRAGISEAEARELLRLHKERYAKFWKWIDTEVNTALFSGSISTRFGWRVNVTHRSNPRSLFNFPMQAHGAEMMRAAAIAATETGIRVACAVHDAFVISARSDEIKQEVWRMRRIMSKAGRLVTGGVEIRTDTRIAAWPDRYMDDRGERMWRTVMMLLDRVEGSRAAQV